MLLFLLILLYTAHLDLACVPFSTKFPAGSVSPHVPADPSAPFVSITPSDSFSINNGLSMLLHRPAGRIFRKGGVNSQIAEGATINSTFTILHGKVTFEIAAPLVPGIVVAAILIAEGGDEIDVELLGGDPEHWQTNIYAPSSSDKVPLWGVFGKIQDLPHSPHTIASTHAYTIDWTAERIIWSVDGVPVRTLEPQKTRKNGRLHYPSHAARVQLGIWDASTPLGTAQWAKGPIDWKSTPEHIEAVVKSLKVECP